MKILFISRYFPERDEPVYGNFEADQAKAMVALGHDVAVLSVDRRFHTSTKRRRGISQKYVDGVSTYKIFVIALPLTVCLQITTYISVILGRYLFRRIKREWGLPDIIHAHYLFNIPLAAWIGRKYNIPFIATEHWSVFNKPTIPKNVLRMARNNYSYLSALISVSVSLQKSLKEVTKHNSIVISNMVDIAYYNYIERERKSYFQYVSIGSLTKRKCFDLLIRAFSQSHFQQDTRLVIVGEGPEYDHLVRLVSTLNLDKQVHLIGKKNRDSIRSILAKSDAFVLPSAFETFGVVYIEALSTGLPVIATQCGGPEDFINSTNGLLIPINDIDALSTALSIMQDTVSNYNPQLISKTTINQFSPIVIAKQIEHIYKKVCNNDLI